MFARFLFTVLLGATIAQPTLAAPAVVVTLPPIHSLAANVMQGVAVPELLISGRSNLHDYALKPSDIRKLEQANILIFSGPRLEPAIEKTLRTHLRSGAKLFALEDGGLTILKTKDGTIDAHYWLHPENAKRIVAYLASSLSQADPANAQLYRDNASKTQKKIDAMAENFKKRLIVKDGDDAIPYISYHNAYRYMEHYFSLPESLALTSDPERGISAKAARKIEDEIKRRSLRCAIWNYEPGTTGLSNIVKETKAEMMTLDPEGSFYSPGPDLYFTMMNEITDVFAECLGGKND